MKAKFDGVCKVCNEKIKARVDVIVKNDEGNWIHSNCSDNKEEQEFP
jgi:predicted DCC family thiol-disulfide oxidoreductase YuxK